MTPTPPPDPARTEVPFEPQTEGAAFATAWAVFLLLLVLVGCYFAAVSLLFP